jgi:hypothetical protein
MRDTKGVEGERSPKGMLGVGGKETKERSRTLGDLTHPFFDNNNQVIKL